jgi:hypothetical protein
MGTFLEKFFLFSQNNFVKLPSKIFFSFIEEFSGKSFGNQITEYSFQEERDVEGFLANFSSKY